MRRPVVIAACAIVVAACGEMRPTSPGRTGGTGGTRVIVPAANPLVGSWSFTRIFYDAAGNAHMSQTVWTFGSAGDAKRTVYADNLTSGFGDVIVTLGTWTASGNVLSVRFEGSTTATLYDYRFDAGALVLAGTAFIRLTQ